MTRQHVSAPTAYELRIEFQRIVNEEGDPDLACIAAGCCTLSSRRPERAARAPSTTSSTPAPT